MTVSLKFLLLLVGVACLFAQGLGATLGRVQFGWLGLGFIAAGEFLA